MKRGVKAKPTEIRELEGNAGNIPINHEQPRPETLSDPTYPEWMEDDCWYMHHKDFPLKEVARMVWDGLYDQLTLLRVLTVVDPDLFGRYCDLFARWLKMKAFLDHHGESYPVMASGYEPALDSDGRPILDAQGNQKRVYKRFVKHFKTYPQVGLSMKLSTELRKYEAEFGIGAASRTSIRLTIQDALDGKDPKPDDFDYATKRRLAMVPKKTA